VDVRAALGVTRVIPGSVTVQQNAAGGTGGVPQGFPLNVPHEWGMKGVENNSGDNGDETRRCRESGISHARHKEGHDEAWPSGMTFPKTGS
jgi:hypothetical protein